MIYVAVKPKGREDRSHHMANRNLDSPILPDHIGRANAQGQIHVLHVRQWER